MGGGIAPTGRHRGQGLTRCSLARGLFDHRVPLYPLTLAAYAFMALHSSPLLLNVSTCE